MTKEFAQALNNLCRKHDIILIADEVQTGLGRTGTLFASQWVGLEPDIITLSKPIAGGLPLSATLLPKKINDLVQVGDHGTTFGGGPVTTRVALEVWSQINSPGFLAKVGQKSAFLKDQLEQLATDQPKLGDLKGAGLLRGIQVKDSALLPDIMAKARDAGLLILRSGTDILRMAPPLIISTEEISEGIKILRKVLEEV
jgi:acetylornithine/N-succinyldiaminopimelate aminotransferase